jgi:nitroimidazol reductase NimA-like FMN-containing flavoprotein (pyridoxamine 5'-phosphate oxidase superfamily)
VDLSPAALLDPRTTLSVAGRLRRQAASNARTAAQALGQQVADRRRLAPTEDDTPGSLSRLTREQCLDRLRERRVGRLAYVARAGVPDVVPVNYSLYDGDVLIRSGAGPKLQAAERRDVVALEVDDIDEDAHAGWSVVAVGRARRLTPSEQDALPEGVLPATWAHGPRSAVIRVHVTRLDGRVLH